MTFQANLSKKLYLTQSFRLAEGGQAKPEGTSFFTLSINVGCQEPILLACEPKEGTRGYVVTSRRPHIELINLFQGKRRLLE